MRMQAGATHAHHFLPCLLHKAHLALVGVDVGLGLDAALVCPMDFVRKHIEQQLGVGRCSQHSVEEGR